MRENEVRSCVEWNFKFEIVLKPSNKLYGIWEQYVKWLKEQKIITIVDFEPWVQIMHKISSDKEYLKEKKENEKIYYKKGELRYGQQTHERCESVIELE